MSTVQCVFEDGIARLVVDRPAARNALDPDTMEALAAQIAALSGQSDLRAVVLHGGGGRFISGGDLRALHALQDGESGAQMAVLMRDTLDALAALPVPVIAAIDAYAIGGGAEVALAADLRVIAADAFIAFKHIEFGLTPGWGGVRRLQALVGPAKARRLLWTAPQISASEALAMGLVDVVSCAGQTALERALDLARSIVKGPPVAVRGVKALLAADPADRSRYDALERQLFSRCWGAQSHWKRVDAFWRGRKN